MPDLPPPPAPADDTGPVPHLQRPARETIPHTTHEKAALYLVIAPHITALADELWALALKSSGLAAEPQVIAQAAALLRNVQHLMRDERGANLVGLSFTPPMLLHALALGMRQLARAVAQFRERYYGYNPLTGGDAWAVSDAYGNPDPRWLGPRVAPDLGTEISELNLMTAEIMRTQLLDLAERTETPLPPNLQRREEEEEPKAAESEAKPAPAPTSVPRHNNHRRIVRLVRSQARRYRPKPQA